MAKLLKPAGEEHADAWIFNLSVTHSIIILLRKW